MSVDEPEVSYDSSYQSNQSSEITVIIKWYISMKLNALIMTMNTDKYFYHAPRSTWITLTPLDPLLHSEQQQCML